MFKIGMLIGMLMFSIAGEASQTSPWQGGWDVNAAVNQLEHFGKHLAKRYHMEYLNKGVGTVVESRKVIWDLSLMSHHPMTIEQARPVIVSMMNEFWQKATQDPYMQREIYELRTQKILPDLVLTPESLGLKIAFWDKDVNRPLPPYLGRIIVAEGKIRYYMANPRDQSLEQPTVETMAEAIEAIKKTR